MSEVFSYPQKVTLHTFQSKTGELSDTLRDMANWLDSNVKSIKEEEAIHAIRVNLTHEGIPASTIIYMIEPEDR